MSAVMALALTGCDTTAELTFQDEQLIEAVPQGLVSPECADMPDADAVFRWSVLTSFDARLTPGKRYASLNAVLEPGKNLSAEDITFTNKVSGTGTIVLAGKGYVTFTDSCFDALPMNPVYRGSSFPFPNVEDGEFKTKQGLMLLVK